MNILHVCSNYYPAFGGPQYTLKHLSEKLVELYGDKVEVATSNSWYGPEMNIFKKITPATEITGGVTINRFPFTRWHYPLLTFGNKVSGKLRGKALPYSIMKHRWAMDCSGMDNRMKYSAADVIMATTVHYNFSDYPLWRFKTDHPKPFVLYGALHLNMHLTEQSPFIQRAKACDCYIANTLYEEQALLSYGVQPHKIVTIGTGIDTNDLETVPNTVAAFRKKYGIQDHEILIGHVGRLSKNKGAGLLLKAFRLAYQKNKNIKLLLAGSSTEYVIEIKQLIEEEHLPVVLLEDFDEQLKPVIFNALDIFVLASRGESFGVVFLEAWACRKPVIGTRTGAIASLMTEGKDGFLFETENPESLAEKLQVLVEHKQLRIEFGQYGYEKVNRNYSWPVIVAKYREAYKRGIDNFREQYP